MNKCSAFQKNPNLILQKRAISPSRLTGTPWGILENILLRHALVDNIIRLLGFDSTFFFFFWFLVVLICENEHLSQKQDLGYWGICLFQALFPNLVSVGISHCSWYSRGLILGPSFSDVGQRPYSVSQRRKSILEDLSLVRIQGSRRFFSTEFNSSRSGLPVLTLVSFWKNSSADGSTRLSICKGHEMDI